MKYFALAVLLVVMQASPPVPRKTADPRNRASQNVKSDSSGDQGPSQQPQNVVQPINAQLNQDTSHSPAAENAQKSVVVRELPPVSVTKDWWDRSYIIFTGILIIVGLIGVRAAYKTLGEIKTQREAMQGQLMAMQGQLDAMTSSGKQTDKLIKHAADQVVALTDAAQAAKETAEAAQINAMNSENAALAATANAQATIIAAQAAKTSADIATGVSLPTLVIYEFSAGNATGAALTAMLQLPKVNLRLKNYGQTPALLKWWSLIFTCEDLPDIPVYDGVPVDRFPASGIVLAKQAIQPNEVYTLTVDDSWRRQHLSIDDVQAIMDRQKTLTAYGYVSYSDIFGNPLRRFKFCETALNFGDGWIDWQSDLAPSGYVGTDQFPFKKEAKSQEKST